MESQIVTIPIRTDIDPSQLLAIVQEIAERLRDEIEAYGEDAEVDEDEISVEYG